MHNCGSGLECICLVVTINVKDICLWLVIGKFMIYTFIVCCFNYLFMIFFARLNIVPEWASPFVAMITWNCCPNISMGGYRRIRIWMVYNLMVLLQIFFNKDIHTQTDRPSCYHDVMNHWHWQLIDSFIKRQVHQ